MMIQIQIDDETYDVHCEMVDASNVEDLDDATCVGVFNVSHIKKDGIDMWESLIEDKMLLEQIMGKLMERVAHMS